MMEGYDRRGFLPIALAMAAFLIACLFRIGSGPTAAVPSEDPTSSNLPPRTASSVAPAVQRQPPSPAPASTPESTPARTRSRTVLRLAVHGEPLAGVLVRLTAEGLAHEGRTDASGQLQFTLPAGEVTLSIPDRNIETAVQVSNGPTTSIQLEVPGKKSLTGHVLDLDSLAPIGDAWVEVFPAREDDQGDPAYRRLAWTTTDAKGRYRLSGLPDRPVRLRVRRRSHAPFDEVVETGGQRDIRLHPNGVVRLRVFDRTGQPALLSPVTVRITNRDGFHLEHDLFLDEKGELHVTDLVAGSYQFRVRIDDVWSNQATAYASPHEEVPAVLVVDTTVPSPDIEIPHGPNDLQEPDDPAPGCDHDHGARSER